MKKQHLKESIALLIAVGLTLLLAGGAEPSPVFPASGSWSGTVTSIHLPSGLTESVSLTIMITQTVPTEFTGTGSAGGNTVMVEGFVLRTTAQSQFFGVNIAVQGSAPCPQASFTGIGNLDQLQNRIMFTVSGVSQACDTVLANGTLEKSL